MADTSNVHQNDIGDCLDPYIRLRWGRLPGKGHK